MRIFCRFVRLGTASLLSDGGGPFINLDKLDLRKYAARPCLARALCDYMLYHDHNPKRALELCAHATTGSNFEVSCLKMCFGSEYRCSAPKLCHISAQSHLPSVVVGSHEQLMSAVLEPNVSQQTNTFADAQDIMLYHSITCCILCCRAPQPHAPARTFCIKVPLALSACCTWLQLAVGSAASMSYLPLFAAYRIGGGSRAWANATTSWEC